MYNYNPLYIRLSTPLFFIITLLILIVFRDTSLIIKIYFCVGCLLAIGLYFIKKSNTVRSVSPINGTVDQNYERLYSEFSKAGFRIDEYEPLDGKQLNVFFYHPGIVYYILVGIILFIAGIFPGILWFLYGRDKLSITLIKENSGFVHYIFQTNNNKYAGKVWFKINMKYTMNLVGPSPDNSETTVDII